MKGANSLGGRREEIQSYTELDGSQQRGSSTVYLLHARCSDTPLPHNQHPNTEDCVHLWAPWGKPNQDKKQPLDKPPLPTCTNHLADPLPSPQTSNPSSLYSTDALYTPVLASRPEDILSARAYTHLFRAPPIETDVHSPRDTYPTGCCSLWPGPATQSQPGPACAPQSLSNTPPTFTASSTGAPLESPTLLLSAP